MPTLVVSIEGPDFSGKSTIANLTLELLRENNKNKNILFKRTNLPSNLITGTFSTILRNSGDKFAPEVFALAYALDHLHHFNTQIKSLKDRDKNFVVIQERSLLSAFIYQSIIAGIDLKWVREINKFTKNIPDSTLILKIDKEELLKRKELENKQFDRFELTEHIEKQIKVFYNLPEDLKKEFNAEYIDANSSPLIVAGRCAREIQKEIDKRF